MREAAGMTPEELLCLRQQVGVLEESIPKSGGRMRFAVFPGEHNLTCAGDRVAFVRLAVALLRYCAMPLTLKSLNPRRDVSEHELFH
jgi:hypothetical protein